MSKRKCGCVYADARNTADVRHGYGMSGYLKTPCATHRNKDITTPKDMGGDKARRALCNEIDMDTAREAVEDVLDAAFDAANEVDGMETGSLDGYRAALLVAYRRWVLKKRK